MAVTTARRRSSRRAAHQPADSQSPAVLRLEGVTKSYRRGAEAVPAVVDVSLAVAPGEFVAVVGRSGSGKSTLLHLAGGLDVPDAGRVLLDQQDIGLLDAEARAVVRRRHVGFVFQFFNLLSGLSVIENVALPLLIENAADAEQRAAAVLDDVGLAHRSRHRPTELSGGEMQRVALARALVARPRLVLADEPTGNLDSATGAMVMELLVDRVRSAGTALIVVTHDDGVAARADRVVTVVDGRLA